MVAAVGPSRPIDAPAEHAAANGGRARGVALLRIDAELRAAVPEDDRTLAERAVVAPVDRMAGGAWSPARLEGAARDPTAALVVDGVLIREVEIADRRMAQLLGPGDAFGPWGAGEGVLPARVRWRADGPVAVAALDARFASAARRWPGLAAVVQRRMGAQLERLAVHCALIALPRVEQRVVGLFWHLAERLGRVGTDGVVVPLRLTHDAIGQLVGAQRPTVSLALRELAEEGTITRIDQARWLLRPGSEDLRATEPGLV